MTVAVTTPTGNVGSRVVRLLLQAGERPRLLLRDPGRLDPETARLVDAVACDQLDRDAVLEATEGVDALFWVDPPAGGEDPVADCVRAGENAAAAVAEHGIDRTVFQSSVGAERRHGAGEISALGRTEALLDATGRSVVHLRCGFFFTNLLLDPRALESGVFPVLLPLDRSMPWVDPRDIGDVAAARLLSTVWSGRHVQAVHGPEHLSWDRATAVLTDVVGRPFRAERIADEQMRDALRGAGMNEAQVEAIVEMSTGLREDFVPEDERTVRTTTPTTLASWAAEHL